MDTFADTGYTNKAMDKHVSVCVVHGNRGGHFNWLDLRTPQQRPDVIGPLRACFFSFLFFTLPIKCNFCNLFEL